MSQKFDFGYLPYDDYPRLAEFIAATWGPEHPYVRKKALFDWAFDRSHLWDRDGYSWLFAEDQGRMISSLGAIPFELNVRGETHRAVWPVTWMTAESYRSKGVGMWLFGMLRRPPFRAIVCFGARASAARIYRALRFQMVDDIPRRVAFLSSRRHDAVELIARTHPTWDISRTTSLTDAYLREPGDPPSLMREAEFWSEWDERGWQPWAPHLVGARRDAAYLDWRYRRHPEYDYRVLAVEDGDRVGCLVWRLDPVHVDRETRIGSFARIVDCLPTSATNARHLLDALWHELEPVDGCIGADFYNYHGPTGRWLGEAGLATMDDVRDGRAIPSGFLPIDRRCQPIPNAVYIRGESGPTYPFDDTCSWYWTKSDADRDVPMW